MVRDLSLSCCCDNIEFGMENPEVSDSIPHRMLEAKFPATNSKELQFRHGYSCPTLHQAVQSSFGPMGVDFKAQIFHTGRNRETFEKWKQEHCKRERDALLHADSQHLRETTWYDPCLPAQSMKSSPRWGAFQWNDRPIPGKEFVVNRHRFGTQDSLKKC